MKHTKRIAIVMMALLVGFTLFAAGQKEVGTAKPVVLKISMAETSADVKAGVLQDLIEEVEAATDGRLKFELYFSNELGSLADVTEQDRKSVV